MKIISTLTIMAVCFIIGITFHAYQKEWIILLLPYQTTSIQTQSKENETSFSQKKITLFFWKYEQWQKEQILMIWAPDLTTNIKTLTNSWIMLLEDEKLIDTDIQLLSAVITSHKELFLSFNKNLFQEQSSTYHKLMIIESLLKTIYEHETSIQSVRFLIHHQIMTDDHLNFVISWPIKGYITN